MYHGKNQVMPNYMTIFNMQMQCNVLLLILPVLLFTMILVHLLKITDYVYTSPHQHKLLTHVHIHTQELKQNQYIKEN